MSFKEQLAIGYATEAKILGAIVEINYLEETVTLMEQNGETTSKVKFDEVIELEQIGIIGRTFVYNHDMLSTEDGKQYEIALNEEGQAELHPLDEDLERVEGMLLTAFDGELISQYQGVLAVVGNIFELREKLPKVDFNIATVSIVNDNGVDVTYYQAGNNKKVKEVDLVKAIMFEEDEYERITLTHKQFLEAVKIGEIAIVDPLELEVYLEELFENSEVEFVDDEAVDPFTEDEDFIAVLPAFKEEDEDENYCAECGEHVDDCDCELWIK